MSEGAASRLSPPPMQHVAGAAFRAILQNIQALDLSFATQAVECFRSIASEGVLDLHKTTQAMNSLKLSGFVGNHAGAEDLGVSLGVGAEYHRLWELWRAESNTADEQCFLFLAWRGHRYSEPSFVKEIALPLFRILDSDGDQMVAAEELEAAIMSEDPAKQLSAEARADVAKLKSELRELFVYHTDTVATGGRAEIDFPGFLALVCDAQDKCAMRRYTAKGPVECMARYHKGVVFLRPSNLAECAQPQEQEELEQLILAAPALEALREARASAEAALQEARTAKAAAEEARQAVAELSSQEERNPAPSAPRPPARIVEAAAPPPPKAEAARAKASVQPAKAKAPQVQLQAGSIEEAPIMEVTAMATFAPPERSTKRVVAVKRTQDVPCRSCQELIGYDSNFCRFCGEVQKVAKRNSSLKLQLKAPNGGSPQRAESQSYVPKFRSALDADTDQLVESVARSPINSRLAEDDESVVEEVVREAFCKFCGTEFHEEANYCANCGHRRGGGQRRSQESLFDFHAPVQAKAAAKPEVAQAKKRQPAVRPARAAASPASEATTATMQCPWEEDDTPTAPAAPPEEDKDAAGVVTIPSRPSEVSLDTLEAVAVHNKETRELATKSAQQNQTGQLQEGDSVKLDVLAVPVAPALVVSSPPVSTGPASTLTNPSPKAATKPQTARQEEEDDYEWFEEEESEEEEAFDDDPVVDPGPHKPQNTYQAKPKARP